MPITHYISAAPIEPPALSLKKGDKCQGFHGSVRIHPYDSRKIILVPYPYENTNGIYEFSRSDIVNSDESSELVNNDGETITVTTIYIRHGAKAVNLRPFTVHTV